MTETPDLSTFRIQVFPVTPIQQNCSLIFDDQSRDAVLVDPGGEAKKLLTVLDKLGLNLTGIWLTHGHMDHAGGADEIREATGAPVLGPHEDDQNFLDTIEASWARFGHSGLGRDLMPDRYLKDGDVLRLGAFEFYVLHTPGHTPGHLTFHNRFLKLAFVGDVLVQGSIGRTDLPGCDHAALINSIRTKLWPLGNDMRFVPGHGPSSTFGAERATNSFVSDQTIDIQPEVAAGPEIPNKLS